ncbi:hypothetical protein Tco_0688542 [Tanacetum coccineum]
MKNPLMMNQKNSMWKQKWSPWSLFQSIKHHLPVIDLSPPEPAPSTTQTPVFTTTTSTTTTTHPLPPPPQQQSTIDSELAARVTSLEQNFAACEQKSKNLDNTTQNLGSRVFTLELRDLTHNIEEVVRENVKEAQRMFETGSYKSLLEHIALFEALEASMERAQRDEFFVERDNSSQPPALQSSAWKSTDTRDAPSDSSKQQSGPHSEQPVKDIPMLDTANISDSEDTDYAYLLKIKPRPEWLKPILEEDRPATPEPA